MTVNDWGKRVAAKKKPTGVNSEYERWRMDQADRVRTQSGWSLQCHGVSKITEGLADTAWPWIPYVWPNDLPSYEPLKHCMLLTFPRFYSKLQQRRITTQFFSTLSITSWSEPWQVLFRHKTRNVLRTVCLSCQLGTWRQVSVPWQVVMTVQ